jgi:hypothetical protein
MLQLPKRPGKCLLGKYNDLCILPCRECFLSYVDNQPR